MENHKEEYKEKIIEMINKVENAEFLLFAYLFIKKLKENWGV